MITDHTESSHAPRQGQPTESKRIRTAYTRHQTLELGETSIVTKEFLFTLIPEIEHVLFRKDILRL